VSEPAYDVEDEGQDSAEEQRSREWEIKGCVLPAIEYIARQTAEGKASSSEKQEDSSQYKQHHTKKRQDFAEFCHYENRTRDAAISTTTAPVLFLSILSF
jgi:hypothetical protein